jgi:hypothetical protein
MISPRAAYRTEAVDVIALAMTPIRMTLFMV